MRCTPDRIFGVGQSLVVLLYNTQQMMWRSSMGEEGADLPSKLEADPII
jgi:hypothetical protein